MKLDELIDEYWITGTSADQGKGRMQRKAVVCYFNYLSNHNLVFFHTTEEYTNDQRLNT
jgi:hypothetical protein